MDEVRAAFAIARKDIRNVSRYRFVVASQVFTPLYQGVLPALLFGASFAVAGHVVGLEKSIGTTDLAGFIFLGGVMSGLVATAFWSMAMSIRNEMETGTLEPTWLTPTSREAIVIGRALGGLFWFAFSQVAIFAIGIAFFGLRFRPEIVLAAPADELLAVHEALDVLAAKDPQAAELVKLRYFVGMTMEEAATAMGLAKRTAEDLWTYARTWLHREIRRQV